MQAIDGDEFLWEVERRAEVMRAAVDMIGVRERVSVRTKEEMPAIADFVTHAEDARASGKSRVFEIGIREVARAFHPVHDGFHGSADHRIILEQS